MYEYTYFAITADRTGYQNLKSLTPNTDGEIISQRLGLRFKDSRLLFFLFLSFLSTYEGWNFNSGNYLFTTDTK